MPSSRGLEGVISLFGFRGLATLPIVKSGSDSGSGTDTSDVYFAIVDSDTGTGAEETPTIAPSLPDTDSGSGTEGTSVLAVTVPGTDTGTGVESSDCSAQPTPSDTGACAEGSSLAVSISSSDSGAGADVGALVLDRMITVEITSVEPFRTIEYT